MHISCTVRYCCEQRFAIALLLLLQDAEKREVAANFDALNADKEKDKRVIRGYEIQEMLGRGAFGTVYQASAFSEFVDILLELPFNLALRSSTLYLSSDR